MPYCVISLAATIEDGMVYEVGHSADGSEAYVPVCWMGPTKASKTETSLHLLKIKKIKIFYVKNAKQNT